LPFNDKKSLRYAGSREAIQWLNTLRFLAFKTMKVEMLMAVFPGDAVFGAYGITNGLIRNYNLMN
jgi:hypothetical protein